MTAQIASNSIREGRDWSRLPALSEQWIATMRGSADFLGLNYYTSRYVDVLKEPSGPIPSHERDSMLKSTVSSEWKRAKSSWLYAVPSGLGDILRFDPRNLYSFQRMEEKNTLSEIPGGLKRRTTTPK